MPATSTVVLTCIAALVVGAGYYLWTPDKPIGELEAKYLNVRSDYKSVSGIRLHVRDTGPRDAPALVLLHGFGASLHTWEPWAQALSERYRVVRFDQPGFGLTGPDPQNDYSDERSLALLMGLLDTLELSRVTLVGNSMGGRLAWMFAAAHPERVDKLVLISPDGFASPGLEYGKAPAVPAMLSLMRYALPRSMLAPNLAAAYADPNFMSEPLLDRYYDLMLAPGNRDAIIARMKQTMLIPPEPALRNIQADTLMLWGEKDALIPISNAADYLRALPHATLVSLPNLGHLPHEEAPQISLRPLVEFLDRRSKPATE